MQFISQTPKESLDIRFVKFRPQEIDIIKFRDEMNSLLNHIDENESEEFHKRLVFSFLERSLFSKYFINTRGKQDLAIHLGKDNKKPVGIIMELKRPKGNEREMFSIENPNVKALHELILYYFEERENEKNNELKKLIITNVYEWFVFDANDFDKYIYRNTQIKKLFDLYKNEKKDKPSFYNEIKKIINDSETKINLAHLDIRKYQQELTDNQEDISKKLINLFKFFSPENLLKRPFLNDTNELNNQFYQELLHLMGLEEVKEKKGNKKIIQRKAANRHSASLVESIIDILQTEGMGKVKNPKDFGETLEEQHFNIALELSITWINRILFLKLLEGQLLTYHKNEEEYRFLNFEKIPTYQELFRLFHQVLAVDIPQRNERVQEKYSKIPYLNSSLFDISELEDATVKVHALDILDKLPFMKGSIIEDKSRPLSLLEYLFQFLDSYDFASEGKSDVRKDNKVLINASVLGKIFEKINGYKEGSVFTPSFITTYMCRQAIRAAVVEKFNAHNKWNIEYFDDLKEKIRDIKQANELINSLKVCDPAVGSGHFLVSALNELIAIKSELDILTDKDGKRIRYHRAIIVNDELSILDEDSEIFVYYPNNPKCKQIQEALFLEKQRIIENCLFGVDINSNSVKICRLRLWIELLKSAYYTIPPKTEKEYWEGKLETFPNIDINIKCGNSLLSRFAVNVDLKEAFKSQKYNLTTYKLLIETYRASKKREEKKQLLTLMNEIKREYTTTIHNRDPRRKKIAEMRGEIMVLKNSNEGLFGKKLSDEEKQTQIEKLTLSLEQKEQEISDVEKGVLYQNGFEWRFEFPEVLNEKGEFMGFDVIIGNPPYGAEINENIKDILKSLYEDVHVRTLDTFNYFISKSHQLLKKDTGLCSFIVPNNLFFQNEFEKTRSLITQEKYSLYLYNLGDNIFADANVPTCIYLLKNCKSKGYDINYADYRDWNKNAQNLFVENKVFKINSQKLKNIPSLVFGINNLSMEIIKKVKDNSYLLDEVAEEMATGISTGADNVFRISTEFAAIKQLETTLLKPILLGSDIDTYRLVNPNHQLIYTNRAVKISDYPLIEKYLEGFKTILNNRSEVKSSSLPWFSLGRQRYEQLFEEPKIIMRQTADKVRAVFDDKGFYVLNSILVLKLKKEFKLNYLYVLAILNSKLNNFIYRCFTQEKGRAFAEVKPHNIRKLFIPKISAEKQQAFADLVIQILAEKEAKKDSQIIENQIDKMIYELYDLTEEEIAIL